MKAVETLIWQMESPAFEQILYLIMLAGLCAGLLVAAWMAAKIVFLLFNGSYRRRSVEAWRERLPLVRVRFLLRDDREWQLSVMRPDHLEAGVRPSAGQRSQIRAVRNFRK